MRQSNRQKARERQIGCETEKETVSKRETDR